MTDVGWLAGSGAEEAAEVENAEPGIAGVHRRVREAILSNELRAGEVVSQVRLADQLGVSRTPLREVLRMLQREGLVESEHNRRVRIAPFSLSDLDEIYAIRIVLEAFAVRMTVSALNADQLTAMREAWEAMRNYAEARDYERWLPPHRLFHELAVSHAGARLERNLKVLSDHAERYRRFYTTQAPDAWEVGVVDHQTVMKACEAGDQDAAAHALAEHLGRVAVSTVALIDPSYDPVKSRGALKMVMQ